MRRWRLEKGIFRISFHKGNWMVTLETLTHQLKFLLGKFWNNQRSKLNNLRVASSKAAMCCPRKSIELGLKGHSMRDEVQYISWNFSPLLFGFFIVIDGVD